MGAIVAGFWLVSELPDDAPGDEESGLPGQQGQVGGGARQGHPLRPDHPWGLLKVHQEVASCVKKAQGVPGKPARLRAEPAEKLGRDFIVCSSITYS